MTTDTASLWAGVRRYEGILKNDPQAYSFAPLAELYLKLGLLEDALKVARKGCVIHPNFAAGQLSLAYAAMENSLTDEAKSALEVVVRVTPENVEAQRLLAELYTAGNQQEAAQRCLAIVNSLEANLLEQDISGRVAAEKAAGEENDDLDVLELTDDLIEHEVSNEPDESLFAAAPERPSLGDAQFRAEPYLLETAPPIYEKEQAEPLPPPVTAEVAGAPSSSIASATIAELYVSQGFVEKGVDIYRALLQDEPDNESWKKRIAELSASDEGENNGVATPVLAANANAGSTDELLETLRGWLENIGRIRECRIKSV